MFRSKTKSMSAPSEKWYYSRIRIYKNQDYIHIGFGGAASIGIPFVEEYMKQVSPSLGIANSYTLEIDGGHAIINNLSSLSGQLGWMLIGILMAKGWFIQEYRKEELPGSNIELIDIMINQ